MLHQEYIDHLARHLDFGSYDFEFSIRSDNLQKEIHIMKNLNLDPALPILNSLYSPAKLESARDPASMLRSLILMTVLREKSITKWVKQTRHNPIFAILGGFEPGKTPGIGTYYDFMKRIINGPYRKPCQCENQVKRSEYNAKLHKRNLKKEKKTKKNDFDPNHSQSEKLAQKLLKNADELRPKDMYQILEDLHIQLGIIPCIQEEHITDLKNLVVSGDGSILKTAASGDGKPTCSCRSEGIYKCDHDRYYTSPSAEWCYDHHKDCYVFGDRYYHLVVTQKGHDFPLLTYMPGGNESDYTLSLKSFDRLLKAARENDLDINVSFFCGDGHHDAQAHYRYFREKNIIPIIPLSKATQKAYPHLSNDSDIRLDIDGTPLCPAGKRMRRHFYDKKQQKHVYNCPAKRNTHRNGKSLYVFHEDDCPKHQDCDPQSPLGPYVNLKSSEDPRLFPPLPRSSRKFKDLMNQRSASERCNFNNDTYDVEGSCRNADYGLIRLTLANIAHHAAIRYQEARKQSQANTLLTPILESGFADTYEYQDSG
ncbi:MAG: hypothetical protein GAS50_08415 [Desulfobacterales bacterium]|nr:hypothetical protein [Desulfobacterales bacterium]